MRKANTANHLGDCHSLKIDNYRVPMIDIVRYRLAHYFAKELKTLRKDLDITVLKLMKDNLMRVVRGDIAAEIMAMTFGGGKELMDWQNS